MKDMFSAVLVFLQMSSVHIRAHESSRVVEAAATCFYVRTCLHTQIKIKLDRNHGLQHPSILLTRVKMCKGPTQQSGSISYKDLPPLRLRNCTKNKHNDIALTQTNAFWHCGYLIRKPRPSWQDAYACDTDWGE